MKITNTFMHGQIVLRPGDPIPADVSDSELRAWKSNGLIGDSYDGPTRRPQPAPTETKPAAPARKRSAALEQPKPAAVTKPAETKTTAENEASTAAAANTSDTKQSEGEQQPAPGADQA